MNDEDKRRKIFDAISEIDDDLIEEARPKKAEAKRLSPTKTLAALAAVLIVAFALSQLSNFTRPLPQNASQSTKPIQDPPGSPAANLENYAPLLEVFYPEAYAYDDFDASRDIREQNPLSEDFLNAVSNFSFQTASSILAENGAGENVNYSPLSLYYALAVATSGAGGETGDELLELLGMTDAATLNEESGNLYRRLFFDNEFGKLLIANSLWLDDDMNGEEIAYKDEFVQSAARNYYASSHNVDFADPTTAEAMAEWIAEKTEGTIAAELEIDPEQIFSIINTIYFCDQWIDGFDSDQTAPGIFHLADGGKVETDFMHSSYFSATFARGEGFTRSSLSLKNENRMVFILPDEGVSVHDLLASPEKLEAAFTGGRDSWGEVIWQIPKFSYSTKLDLNETLQGLGVESAFTSEADFTGITEHQAFINDVSQETHIEINEEGVVASAYTHIAFPGTGMPEDRAEMILDRPFICGITKPVAFATADGYEGVDTLLFVGICENPTS